MIQPPAVTRRRFLIRCAAFGAGVSLSGLSACNSDFEPKETWKLWVAKTLRGAVQTSFGSYPVVNATVRFWAGLKPNQYALLGTTHTGVSGAYSMSAEEHPSADAGFWRFIIDHSFFRVSSDDVPVYCRVEALVEGRLDSVEFTLLRKPQKTLPPDSEAFHLVQNIRMW